MDGAPAPRYSCRVCRALILLGLVPVLLTTACAAVDPYVYQSGEFNRDAPGFGREPDDVTEVAVCYLSARTSGGRVAEIAEERCAAFGRTARLRGREYGVCPLATPVLARFDCLPDVADLLPAP